MGNVRSYLTRVYVVLSRFLSGRAAPSVPSGVDARNQAIEHQHILEHAGVGLAFLKNRRVVRCNRTFAEVFGYRVEELAG
ncbi:MAG: PAS domain-containing protein, partial [Bacillota bacterium]